MPKIKELYIDFYDINNRYVGTYTIDNILVREQTFGSL